MMCERHGERFLSYVVFKWRQENEKSRKRRWMENDIKVMI